MGDGLESRNATSLGIKGGSKKEEKSPESRERKRRFHGG